MDIDEYLAFLRTLVAKVTTGDTKGQRRWRHRWPREPHVDKCRRCLVTVAAAYQIESSRSKSRTARVQLRSAAHLVAALSSGARRGRRAVRVADDAPPPPLAAAAAIAAAAEPAAAAAFAAAVKPAAAAATPPPERAPAAAMRAPEARRTGLARTLGERSRPKGLRGLFHEWGSWLDESGAWRPLSLGQVKAGLRALGDEATGGVKLTDGVCHAIFRTMDRDCDGRVSLADLTAAIDDALEPDADR